MTNNAYAVKSMKCGDGFAHKFAHGDSLLLIIKGYSGGSPTGQVGYFLADFRGAGAGYIVDSWKWVNLTSLGTVDSLAFSLATSDVGDFGANTPMYFCIDGIKVGNSPSCGTCAATDGVQARMMAPVSPGALPVAGWQVKVAPNPAATQITVAGKAGSLLEIFDALGNSKLSNKMSADTETVSITHLLPGVYAARVSLGNEVKTVQFVKK